MSRMKVIFALVLTTTITTSHSASGQNLLDKLSGDFDKAGSSLKGLFGSGSEIEGQGCALGGLAGTAIGGYIAYKSGSDVTSTLGGALLGGTIGSLIGCSAGEIIEERRSEAASDADFYDEQIKLTNRRADELERGNKDIAAQIKSIDREIERNQNSGASYAQQLERYQDLKNASEASERDYKRLADDVEEEVEVQEAVLAELRGSNPGEAKKLEREIKRLKAENNELEEHLSALSARSDRIGTFL